MNIELAFFLRSMDGALYIFEAIDYRIGAEGAGMVEWREKG